ncbi:MAG: glutathione S-transferase [Gammaproteobacteria bacterium]|jgi:glutathione S-transferase
MAINFYLANKYGKALLPDNAADQARLTVEFRGMSEIESEVIALFVELDYLLADRFTIADLNLASIISLYKFVGKPLEDLIDPFPRINGWLHDQCLARPAYKKVMARSAASRSGAS